MSTPNKLLDQHRRRTKTKIIKAMKSSKTGDDLRAFLREETQNTLWPTITQEHLDWLEGHKDLVEEFVVETYKTPALSTPAMHECIFCVRLMRALSLSVPKHRIEPVQNECTFKTALHDWVTLPDQTWLEFAVFDHVFDNFPSGSQKNHRHNVTDALKHYLRIPSSVFEEESPCFDISSKDAERILSELSSMGYSFDLRQKICKTICDILISGMDETVFVIKVLKAINGKVCWVGTKTPEKEIAAFNALKNIKDDAAANFYALVGPTIQKVDFHMKVANTLFIGREASQTHAKIIEICLKFIETPFSDFKYVRPIKERNEKPQTCDANDSGVLFDLIAIISKLGEIGTGDLFTWACFAILAWAPTMQNHPKHGKFVKMAFNARVVEGLIVSFKKKHALITNQEKFKSDLKQFLGCCTLGAEESQRLLGGAPKELKSVFSTDQFPSADYSDAMIGVKRKLRTKIGLMEVCHNYICSGSKNGVCPSCKILRKLFIISPCGDHICEDCSKKEKCSTCNCVVKDIVPLKDMPEFDEETIEAMEAFF